MHEVNISSKTAVILELMLTSCTNAYRRWWSLIGYYEVSLFLTKMLILHKCKLYFTYFLTIIHNHCSQQLVLMYLGSFWVLIIVKKMERLKQMTIVLQQMSYLMQPGLEPATSGLWDHGNDHRATSPTSRHSYKYVFGFFCLPSLCIVFWLYALPH